MASTLNAVVNLNVNNGVKDILQRVKNFASGSVDLYTSGQLELASGAAEHSLSLGGIVTVKFFWMVAIDESTKVAKSVSIDLDTVAGGAEISMPGAVSEILWASPENADIGDILLTVQSDGSATIIEYVIGGDK